MINDCKVCDTLNRMVLDAMALGGPAINRDKDYDTLRIALNDRMGMHLRDAHPIRRRSSQRSETAAIT